MNREGPFSSFENQRLTLNNDSSRRNRSYLDSEIGELSVQKTAKDVCVETQENVTNVRNC